jgi:hypothetical protein
MAGFTSYKITITNWEKHNGNKKKNHRYFLMENRFFEDSKINQLKQIDVLLFIKCLAIAGDLNSNSFEIHAGLMPKRWRIDDKLLANCCKTLEQNQLLTAEKVDSLLIQYNTREKKRIEKKTSSSEVTKTDQDLNKKIWESYRESYFQRYKVEPVRNASVNAKISQLGKRVGEDALEIVKFYLQHNDGFYLKNLHSIGLCLKDCESLHTQWKRGRAITGADARRGEKHQTMLDTIAAVEKGGL